MAGKAKNGGMRMTAQRIAVIDYMRAYGPMSRDDMLTRTGCGKRNLSLVLKGLADEGGVTLRDGSLHLMPYGYTARGSFPPKGAGHE